MVLTVVILQSISFANYALTTKTTNIIYGSAPYLTFDGGRTRVTNTEALLGISLSDGRTFTPTTNNSSFDNPIILPVAGQSFNDIGMLVPRNTNSIALSSLIGTPYNYWGDDDGDGQGVNGVAATGSLNLSIVDKDNNPVSHTEVLTMCKAPYKLTLSNGEGTLTTRYGVPNESRFSAGNATYYINPKASPAICYARPNLVITAGLSAAVWAYDRGFLTQSFSSWFYDENFPTTGANNLYFDLDISGSTQALSWAPVSHGGITATMTDSTSTSVRVTLTGPVATPSQWQSQYPGEVARPSLPQTFELVGRDSSGNAVVKYGFKLKQWFVNRGTYKDHHSNMKSWCNRLGYRFPAARDLTNTGGSQDCRGAMPPSHSTYLRRHIGAGLFTEWGQMDYYTGTNFYNTLYSVSDRNPDRAGTLCCFVFSVDGRFYIDETRRNHKDSGLCVYP